MLVDSVQNIKLNLTRHYHADSEMVYNSWRDQREKEGRFE